MKFGILVVASILITEVVPVWSQDSQTSPPQPTQASGESQTTPVDARLAAQPDNWPPPPLVNNSAVYSTGNASSYGTGNQVWASAGVLLWAISPGHSPALATMGTPASGGAIGPGTTVIADGKQDYNARTGGIFTLGTWLNPGRTTGIEGSYFFLNGPSDNVGASSSGAPGTAVLARPFINAITGKEDSQLVGYPGVTGGGITVHGGSSLQGAQLNGLCNICCFNSCPMNCCSTGCCQTGCGQSGCGLAGFSSQSGYRVDMIGGFQYLNLNESLVITENVNVLPTAPPPFVPGSTILVTDSFQTSNSFYGGQIGARAEWYRGAWFLNTTSQVALGDTHQQVSINGSSVFTNPGGASVTERGGLLALPTNIGTYSRDVFSVVPTIGLNVGRQLTPNIRVYVGYMLLYWSNVVRPGDQIDPVINTTQLPTPAGPGTLVGPARPAFTFHETGLWAQGINFGLAISF